MADRDSCTIRLHVQDRAFEFPVTKVSAVRLASNLIITVEKMPFCITPRNGNLDDGKTIEDILKLITDPEQTPGN